MMRLLIARALLVCVFLSVDVLLVSAVVRSRSSG
jgi:hypothetical protein